MNTARNHPNRVVAAVGADCAEGVDSLLHFAADEAVRTGADLHLVHVMTMPPSLPEAYVVAYEGARELGTSILDEATRTATKLVAGRVPVTSELVDHGSGTVSDLVERSADARLVVLQHRHLTGLRRIASGSTTHGVAARAHTPVVSVPEGWRPPDQPFGRVTVGVHDAARADDALRVAFELAQERQAKLLVVHAWWLTNGYDSVVVGDDMRKEFSDRFEAELAPHIEALRAEFGDVEVEVQVAHGQSAAALTTASETSDLMVLGRRHPTLPIGSHLGSVARAVIRFAACPVAVVETARGS
ncbi:MAG: universal stress protein [Nocardioides sp.]|jgi:nucleotide-binding universal stress UspA family protein